MRTQLTLASAVDDQVSSTGEVGYAVIVSLSILEARNLQARKFRVPSDSDSADFDRQPETLRRLFRDCEIAMRSSLRYDG